MFTGMKISTIQTNNDESIDSKRTDLSKQCGGEEDKTSCKKTSEFPFINDSSNETIGSDVHDDVIDQSRISDALKDTLQLDPYHSNSSGTNLENKFSLDLDGLEISAAQDELKQSCFNFIKHGEDDVKEVSIAEDAAGRSGVGSSGDELEEVTSAEGHQDIGLMERVEILKLSSYQESKKERTIHKHINEITKDSISSVMELLDKQSLMNELKLSEKKALQDENYEKAEELNISLEQIKNELKKLSIIQPHTHTNYNWLLSNMNQLTNEEILQLEQEAELANQLKTELEKTIEDVCVKKRYCEQDTRLEIQKRRQKLDTAKGHLKLDQEDIIKCETLLEDRIGEETKNFVSEKSLLEFKRQCIKDEIEELLKKLASLRKEEDEIKANIEEQDKLIEKARKGFAKEINQLENDKQEVRNKEHELNAMEEILTLDEEVLKADSKCFDEEESRYKNLLTEIQDIIHNNNTNLKTLKDSKSQLIPDLTPVTLATNSLKCISRLQDLASDGVEKIKYSTSVMITKQTEVTLQAKTLASLQYQIEEIDVAKQAAVQGKHFSEAKKLSIELKTLTEEVDAVAEQLEGSKQVLKILKEDLMEMRKEQGELETQLKDKEQEQDVKQLESARVAFNKIKELLSEGGHQPNIEMLLEAEIQICCLWMKYLCCQLKMDLDEDIKEYLEQHPVSNDLIKSEQRKECQEARNLIGVLQKSLQTAIEEENYDAAESIQLEIETLESVL